METANKGRSPFFPGQPVPIELFVGRQDQIERIISRGIGQVELGKPISIFIQGEYGIGKSSIASYLQRIAESEHNLHAIYAPLGGALNLEDVSDVIFQATVQSGAFDPSKSEKIRSWLAKYIGQQKIMGISINFAAFKSDVPNISSATGILAFLREAYKKLSESSVKGIFLVLDEINGITSDDQFAHFIKGLVDNNALSREPLPLLLMLCGVEERRRELIEKHKPIERIFDVIEITPLSTDEMADFFKKAFSSVNTVIDEEAIELMTTYSAGLPKIMHLIGDFAFWIDKDSHISADDATEAIISAAGDVGRKFVQQQVIRELKSKDYHSILKKIAQTGLDMSFQKKVIEQQLTESEKKKFNNFLQKMKKLKVLRSGDLQGEYVFNEKMVRVYIWLENRPKK
jgi:hypothetical protein